MSCLPILEQLFCKSRCNIAMERVCSECLFLDIDISLELWMIPARHNGLPKQSSVCHPDCLQIVKKTLLCHRIIFILQLCQKPEGFLVFKLHMFCCDATSQYLSAQTIVLFLFLSQNRFIHTSVDSLTLVLLSVFRNRQSPRSLQSAIPFCRRTVK